MRWSEGRHVIELEYVLDEVFMTVAGNVGFELGDGCGAAEFAQADEGDGHRGRIVRRKSYTDNREIIAFTPPAGMTASPIHPYERQR